MTGFLNIDKREGDTSAYVVNRIKALVKCPCGHMGTLDPYASGVLPVGIGNATRLFDRFLEKKKRYLAKFRFGVTSPTLDREGELVFGGEVPKEEQIERVLPELTGKIEQIPPIFSAKFVNGKRSYELARQGEKVYLAPRRVEIYDFRLLERTAPDEFSFEIECGGGTYIRALARDLAEKLGTNGYMSALRRTQSGVFDLQTAVPLEKLTKENFQDFIIPTEEVLPLPVLEISDERLYHGLQIPCERADGEYKLYRGGEFYGIAAVKDGLVRTEKKLC